MARKKRTIPFDEEHPGWIPWLKKIAAEAGKKAAEKAYEVMGYTVVAKDGWVVKKYKDGRIEKISKIERGK